MRWLKDELGPDRLVAAGSVVAAFALVLFGLAHEPIMAICACLLAGGSWTVVITKLYVSAQIALPDWARGRGLAVFLSFIFGATTVGSAVWGKLSAMAGLPIAYFVAAAGVVLGVPLAWRWKLHPACWCWACSPFRFQKPMLLSAQPAHIMLGAPRLVAGRSCAVPLALSACPARLS
jgi:predicted MFS family arabinose efflux permease